MSELPVQFWNEFRSDFQLANEHLVGEMVAAADDARSLLAGLRNQLASAAPAALEPGQLASFEHLFGELEQHLFSEPLGTFERLRPIGRSLAAIDRHQREMSDLPRRLPVELTIAGADLVEMVGSDARGGWRKAWLKRSKSARPIRLREIVLAHLQAETRRRAPLDGDFELALAQAGLHLAAAWQTFRRHQLGMLVSGSPDGSGPAEERKWWTRTAARLAARLERLAGTCRRWAGAAPGRLGDAVLRRSPKFTEQRVDAIAGWCQANVSDWHRQRRAVAALIDLERQLTILAGDAIRATQQALDSLHAEHADILSELDGAIGWLEATLAEDGPGAFPVPQARLLSAEQRARDWSNRVASSIRAHIPVSVETVRPVRAVLGWRKPWRQLQPRSVFLHSLQHGVLDAAHEGFREAETEHTAAVTDVEQARQVVKFALEAEQAERSAVPKLPREAAANALALLRHRKGILIDPLPAAEAGLCRAQALTLLETHTALEVGRLGVVALLTRQGAPRATRELCQAGMGSVRTASQAFRASLGKAFQWASWKVGWETPAAPRPEPIVEQHRLNAVLEVQPRSRDLPALYQRLFNLAPVEDQRFLVGRESELGGLTRAFSLWQSGPGVTVLVVGARGSGKTSLLNCAAQVAFPGVPVVRSQFSRRIVTCDAMHDFLRDLFGISAGADLEAALRQGRRVAVIEEFERTFLRRMNGFDAVRGFLRLMTATSASTLWILSMNQASFGYLDSVLDLGRCFSHRANAMSVSREHMIDAILQRHTLSGLRLQFAPPPPGDPRLRGLRRFLGLERTSQQLFFDALYRHSEGLFRSAFELWLGSIERIEGGVSHMLQPLDPDYGAVASELNPEDLFGLQAILQHASLTPEEMAEVFDIPLEDAHSRLERLLALEILEPEPAGPGFRIRPQAGHFVRDALARQNLL
jgi:energy-coupling factor transporter ATP-binding protein EcfA2